MLIVPRRTPLKPWPAYGEEGEVAGLLTAHEAMQYGAPPVKPQQTFGPTAGARSVTILAGALGSGLKHPRPVIPVSERTDQYTKNLLRC